MSGVSGADRRLSGRVTPEVPQAPDVTPLDATAYPSARGTGGRRAAAHPNPRGTGGRRAPAISKPEPLAPPHPYQPSAVCPADHPTAIRSACPAQGVTLDGAVPFTCAAVPVAGPRRRTPSPLRSPQPGAERAPGALTEEATCPCPFPLRSRRRPPAGAQARSTLPRRAGSQTPFAGVESTLSPSRARAVRRLATPRFPGRAGPRTCHPCTTP